MNMIWYVVAAIAILLLVGLYIHESYFSYSIAASEKLIRRTIEKHPELRSKIQEHLESKVLTRGDLAGMETDIVIDSLRGGIKKRKEDERQKQLDFFNKDL